MLKKFKITNFKSIEDIEFSFDKKLFFVGKNSSGKSTILQSLDFVSQLAGGTVNSWLEQRSWLIKDLVNKNIKSKFISIEIIYQLNSGQNLEWKLRFDTKILKCIEEQVLNTSNGRCLLKLKDKDLQFEENKPENNISQQNAIWNYEGSILSSLNSNVLSSDLVELVNGIKNISSLELLSPSILRKRSRSKKDGKVGIGGEFLSGIISNLDEESKSSLITSLQKFYPKINNLDTKNLKGGWKQLIFHELNRNNNTVIEATHMSDGLLRVLAVLTQIRTSSSSLILLDEIENGVNHSIIKQLIDILMSESIYFIATTHSPLILNFIDDQDARECIYYTYKSNNGNLKIQPLFHVVNNPELLEVLGAGDIYANTDLEELDRKLIGKLS